MSYPTTDLGSWSTLVPHEGMTLEDGVEEAPGDFVDHYDVAAICAQYRSAISAALPGRITLAGNDFYGPALNEDRDWDGAPDLPDIAAIIDGIDFWAIAERHERTVQAGYTRETPAAAAQYAADEVGALGRLGDPEARP